jgi:ribosomal protein S11
MPTEIEIVLNGWRQNFDATLRQSLDSPQAFELRRRVTQVRDETPIPVSAPRPRRRRII